MAIATNEDGLFYGPPYGAFVVRAPRPAPIIHGLKMGEPSAGPHSLESATCVDLSGGSG
jgi:hypothetical protein